MRYLVFVLAMVFFIPAFSEELDEKASTAALVQQLGKMRSLKTTFHQLVQDGKQTALQEVDGMMWIQRPGQFRWDTNEPYPQQIISNGTIVWVYDIDLEQVIKQKLDTHVGNTPALLLSGDPATLSKSFAISAWKSDDNNEWRFDLKPKSEDAVFEKMRVTFIKNRLTDMFLHDALGQTTHIAFTKTELNPDLPSSIFEFTPPVGTDVIEDL